MTSLYSKDAFIHFALEAQVLKFGNFVLKSGRRSPYFFNAGLFYTGSALQYLGRFYADKLIQESIDCTHLFGPAYKGLPLATSVAIALAERGIESTVTFNRKEIKDHGEGGQLIGSPLSGNTVMVDDVITAGTAFREAWQHIKNYGGHLTTVIIALDREECGLTRHSTIAEIEKRGIRVLSLITLSDLLDYLYNHNQLEAFERVKAYQAQYGAPR